MNSRNTKESSIDKKYRELIFQYSIENIKESKNTRVPKYEFPCPFCSADRKDSNKKARCSALFWVESRGCFRFGCFNNGSYDCKFQMEFPKFLERLNPACFGSISGSGFTQAPQVVAGTARILRRYWT
jgi:hypothetical protein